MIAALLWMALLVAIYIMSYLANKHTPKPKGCDEMVGCKGCSNVMCGYHPAQEEEEGKND